MKLLEKPTLVLLPGGPGLSSDSLEGLFDLDGAHKIVAVDPQRTESDYSYASQVRHIEAVLNELDGPVFLCGHSAGGLFATDLAGRLPEKVRGLICLATPFSQAAWAALFDNYATAMTPKLKKAEEEFSAKPSRESFNRWLASYDSLYFTPDYVDVGNEMLLRDHSVFEAYLGATDDVAKKEILLEVARNLKIPKLFLAAENDRLFPLVNAIEDAEAGNFELRVVKNSGHFLNLEQPTVTKALISEFLNNSNKGDL